jgi:hypothetical protein
MLRKSFLAFTAAAALAASAAQAKNKCPDAIKASVQRDYPDGKVSSCKERKTDGTFIYELKVKTADSRKLQVDVSPEGKLLQAQRKVDREEVPAAVRNAFQDKYPNCKIKSAQRQTHPDGAVSYQVDFWDNGKRHHAVFEENGAYLRQW